MKRKRRYEENDEHIDESWLIPYADLLTLLLALFIVLYSMNSVDVKKFEDMSRAFKVALHNGSGMLDMPSAVERGNSVDKVPPSKDKKKPSNDTEAAEAQKQMEQEQAEFDNLKQQIDEYIATNGLSHDLDTELNMSQLLITIREGALFDPAQAIVKSEARQVAISISKMLQEYPDYEVIVSGHTDDTPMNNAYFKSNWELSVMRAISFMDIMLENKELHPDRFRASGFSEYRPIAPNDSKENKAKNRRVEVAILRSNVDPDHTDQLSITPE